MGKSKKGEKRSSVSKVTLGESLEEGYDNEDIMMKEAEVEEREKEE